MVHERFAWEHLRAFWHTDSIYLDKTRQPRSHNCFTLIQIERSNPVLYQRFFVPGILQQLLLFSKVLLFLLLGQIRKAILQNVVNLLQPDTRLLELIMLLKQLAILSTSSACSALHLGQLSGLIAKFGTQATSLLLSEFNLPLKLLNMSFFRPQTGT